MLTKGNAPDELIKINHVLSYEKGDMTSEIISTLDNELWKEVGFKSFADLVYSPMPYGFESTRAVFRHWFRSAPKLLGQIDRALPDEDITPYEVLIKTQTPLAEKGGNPDGNNQHSHRTGSITTRPNIAPKPKKERGSEYNLKRLKRDSPELLERVSKGEISSNQAAIQAGFRKKSISIPYDPQEAARALKRRYEKTEWDLLLNEIQLLAD